MKTKDFIDLHAHPSLKLYYFPYLFKNFKIKTFSGPIFNPLGMRTRYSNINSSSVKVIINAHYVIEKNFLKEGFKKPFLGFLWGLAPSVIHKIMSREPYEALIEQFDLLEESVNKIKYKNNEKKLKMIYSYSELENLKENEVAVIHAIEGAHSLGEPRLNESNEQFLKLVENRIKHLKNRGLAMVGIAHFWDNMFMPQTDGTEIIEKRKKGKIIGKRNDLMFKMKRAEWKFGDKNKLSKEFIELLLKNDILVDIVHTQEHARNEIYKICEKQNKPLVVSHVGLKHFFNHEYNLSDTEILKIHELQGIIGLIFSKRWLVSPENRKNHKGGIEDLIENIKYIKKLTGDVSIAGIGTDFDGFTTPFTDCYTYAQTDKLVNRLKQEFTEKEVEDILHNNALRVLKQGWK